DTDNLWLSTDLVHGDGYDDELIETIGHEVEHARQLRCGHEFNEIAAQAAGKRFLESVYTRLEERDRNEFKELKAKAALPARAFQYLPMGSSFGPPYDPHAHVRLPQQKPRRAEFSYDRPSVQTQVEAKYASGMWAPAATVGEAAYRRLSDVAHALWALLVRLNNGNTVSGDIDE